MASGLWKVAVLALGTLFAMAFADRYLDILSKATETFSSNIFSEVRDSFKNKNMAISPVSLHPVLAMVEMGAKGETRRQLLKALALPNRKVDWADAYSKLSNFLQDPAFTTASALFCASDVKFKKSYVNKVSSIGASLKRTNFTHGAEAASTINNWVNAHTNGKIPKLYESSSFDEDTALVIVNAIHFKADWQHKFEPAQMKNFHSPTGTIQVPMMFSSAQYLYGEPKGLQAQVIALPYKSSKFKMLIILPTIYASLDVVQDNLAKIGLSNVWKSLRNEEVKVSIPKFKIESDLDLVGPLQSMGITHLFDQSRADLSGMVKDLGSHNKLYVSEVKQKVFIEVNEEGTEAAAATGLNMGILSLPLSKEELTFIADRPFLFSVCADGFQLVSGRMLGEF